MSNTGTTRQGIRGGRLFFLAGWTAVFALIAGFGWQMAVEKSRTDDAGNHDEVATLIETAEAHGVASGALLQQYVQTGDAALLPQMQAETDLGVRTLTSAIGQAGGDPNRFVGQGSEIVQSAGQIIAMRQSGDIEGAVAALVVLGETFTAFIADQDEFVAAEREKAAIAADDANTAETGGIWLAVASAVLGIVMSGASAVAVNRGFNRHRTGGVLPAS